MSSIEEKERKVIEEFSLLSDWNARYGYLIELGKRMEPLAFPFKTDANKIKGCQSQVWLHADLLDGRLLWRADSDTAITRGIIALLIRVLNNETPQDVASCSLEFIDAIGLSQHLSPTRSNGLLSMVNHMKAYAKKVL